MSMRTFCLEHSRLFQHRRISRLGQLRSQERMWWRQRRKHLTSAMRLAQELAGMSPFRTRHSLRERTRFPMQRLLQHSLRLQAVTLGSAVYQQSGLAVQRPLWVGLASQGAQEPSCCPQVLPLDLVTSQSPSPGQQRIQRTAMRGHTAPLGRSHLQAGRSGHFVLRLLHVMSSRESDSIVRADGAFATFARRARVKVDWPVAGVWWLQASRGVQHDPREGALRHSVTRGLLGDSPQGG